MRDVKKSIVGAVILSLAAVAYADVARSASGKGASEADAVKNAHKSAEAQYGSKIKSWGAKTCSSETVMQDDNSDLYKVKKVAVVIYQCDVEFTTTD
jgi:uncharacterized protein (DUF2147 family)